MKALVDAFNHEKVVGVFSVIIKPKGWISALIPPLLHAHLLLVVARGEVLLAAVHVLYVVVIIVVVIVIVFIIEPAATCNYRIDR